jgi:cytochrome bd-type quinol oxidase subunit 1
MTSAKVVIGIGLTSSFIGVAAVILVFQDVTWARYVCYVAIPIGAVALTAGGIAASIGRVKDDIR